MIRVSHVTGRLFDRICQSGNRVLSLSCIEVRTTFARQSASFQGTFECDRRDVKRDLVDISKSSELREWVVFPSATGSARLREAAEAVVV